MEKESQPLNTEGLPPGSWLESAKDYNYENGVLTAKLKNNAGD